MLVFRPKLERRLTTLEKRLKVPEEERHVCEGKLDKAAVVEIVGTRVYHRDQSLKLDPFGRNINKSARLSGKATSSASAAQRSLLAAWVQPAVVPLEKHPPEVCLLLVDMSTFLTLAHRNRQSGLASLSGRDETGRKSLSRCWPSNTTRAKATRGMVFPMKYGNPMLIFHVLPDFIPRDEW